MQRDILGSAMRVVEHLSKNREAVGLRDLSRDLGIAVASAHRILRALCRERLAVQVGDRGMYASGERLTQIASNLLHANVLVPLALPLLREAAAESGESALIMVAEGHESVCRASVESEQILRVVFPVGWRGPLYRGATGRVLLAYQTPQEIQAVIARGQRAASPLKLTKPDDLRRSLAKIRRAGYGVSHGERHEHWSSVAAPVRGPHGLVIASVAIYGPSSRFSRGGLPERVALATACAAGIGAAIQQRLGHAGGGRHEHEGA
jgi:DNA-binding IclR family transcriptional regulator